MLISRNWLKKYVKLADTASANDIASKLTESTVEVEGYEDKGKSLENVVVGKVVQVEKHPQADKLVVCNVDIGSERVVIVCGGSNVVKGMLVAVAKVGALVAWHGEGDLVRLKPTEIRGIESHGMICSSDEIGLAELFPKKQEKEILDLTFLKIKPGVPVAVALGLQDIIFEIDNKSLSNRPDLWGHYGIAREVAALYAREVLPYTTKEIKEGKEEYLKVKVQEQQWCSRYSAIIIDGITITDSPEWLKKSLLAVGIQPINNIVDITNFIMLDIGQPMHAFDASSLASAAIVVRKAFDQEKFTTLDGKEYVLNTDMLVVADEHKPLALAGVMGGLDSAIKPGTTKVIFESACFNAGMVRKTSTLLGLRTDASMRFEKNLDPTMCEIALKKAVELVVTTCVGARVVSKVVDVYPKPLRQPVFKIEHAMFAKKIGVDIPLKTIQVILKRLGFTVEEKNKLLSITVPTWRATKDISLAEDIVEEIVRMYGYQAIPGVLPSLPMMPPQENRLRSLEHRVRDSAVVGENYTEVYNYSFVSQDQIHALQDDQTLYLELDNPLSKEKPYLRRNVLISLLDTVEKNSVEEELRLFEIGKNISPKRWARACILIAMNYCHAKMFYFVQYINIKKSRFLFGKLKRY
jgi:phenylalanyl-tRNA synthetase beta chain